MRVSFWGLLLSLLLMLIVGFMFYVLWYNENKDIIANKQSHGFPQLSNIDQITISYREKSDKILTIQDPNIISAIFKGLATAPRSHFDDPEFSGTLFRIEFRQTSSKTLVFELNDLRGTGSNLSGKIYPNNPQRDEVWSVPLNVMEMLLRKENS